MNGTIREREAKSVVLDLIKERGVSPSLYKMERGKLNILVGSRLVEIKIPRGLSYYGLQDALRQTEAAIRDLEHAKKHRQQIDIEDVLAGKATEAA